MEAPLHLGEAQPGVLLFPPDPLQLFLAVLLGDAGALLPLLDALREDLVDAAVNESSHRLGKQLGQKLFYPFVDADCGGMFRHIIE